MGTREGCARRARSSGHVSRTSRFVWWRRTRLRITRRSRGSGSVTRRLSPACLATCSNSGWRPGWSRSGSSRSTGPGCTRTPVVTRTPSTRRSQGDPGGGRRGRPRRGRAVRRGFERGCAAGGVSHSGRPQGVAARSEPPARAAQRRRARSPSRVLTGCGTANADSRKTSQSSAARSSARPSSGQVGSRPMGSGWAGDRTLTRRPTRRRGARSTPRIRTRAG
jgi:hypothetical protein